MDQAHAYDDRLEELKHLKRVVAQAIDEAEPQSVAALAGRYQDLLKEIAELQSGSGGKGEGVDRLAERRAARAAARGTA